MAGEGAQSLCGRRPEGRGGEETEGGSLRQFGGLLRARGGVVESSIGVIVDGGDDVWIADSRVLSVVEVALELFVILCFKLQMPNKHVLME